MKIKILYFTALREITRKKEEAVELQSQSTVKDLLIHLAEKYGDLFKDYLFDGRGELNPSFMLFVNGKSIAALQGLKTRLEDGDELVSAQPAPGG